MSRGIFAPSAIRKRRPARSFIEIADQGSLTRAAETLDLSRAMISRHLEGLERWLGARLLHRTTRRVSLSEAGLEALPRLRQMLELASDLQAAAGAHRTEPTGKLRITTSLSFAVSCLTCSGAMMTLAALAGSSDFH